MMSFIAFIQKEFTELMRTNKLIILSIIFIAFGIMNPAIAKITPLLMDSLEDSGLTITNIHVDALTSWTQFYKNIPIALIVFILFFSSTLTSEYEKGTLINILTKGLNRWKVIISKTLVITIVWTIGYWVCYGITYGYTAYFWDNSIASNLGLSAFCLYILGIWLISLIILISTIFKSNANVIIMVGGVFIGFYLLGLIPSIKEYLPTQLLSSSNLLSNSSKPSDYLFSILITILLSIIGIITSIYKFNKKSL